MPLRRLQFQELDGVADAISLTQTQGALPPNVAFPLALYLREGHLIANAPRRFDDVLNPALGPVVIRALRTDGVWAWDEGAAYYVDTYGCLVDPAFIEHCTGNNWTPPTLTATSVRAATAELLPPH